MSLLKNIQQKKSQLLNTVTIITEISGKKYLENIHKVSQPLELKERSYGFIVDLTPDSTLACIIENFLYLGSQDAVNMKNVKKYNITHILSIGIQVTIDSETPLNSKFLPFLDFPESNLYNGLVQKAVEYIEVARKCQGHVLVHCNAGLSRSPSVIIAYLMQAHNMLFDDAYNLVKSKRNIKPNQGFIFQLKNYNKSF